MLSFTLPTDPQKLIKDLIDYHKQNLLPRYERLHTYYMGQHDITKRRSEEGKPNNKVVNPYPDLIISTVAGYMLGQPVKWLSEDETYLKKVQEVFGANNEEDHNLEILKTFSTQGEAFELVYLDENAEINFAQLPNDQTIAIYDDSIKPKLQLVLRYYPIGSLKRDTQPQYKVELYWPDHIDHYS